MNIFVLAETPKECAQHQCDKHSVKMVLESAQMLSTIQRYFGSTEPELYKMSHLNHPCTIWARTTSANYEWLVQLFNEQAIEYMHRYERVHSSSKLTRHITVPPNGLPVGPLTLPPQCMPDEYKTHNPTCMNDIVQAYRRFYKGEKAAFAAWNKSRSAPTWWI